ncbi:MAG: O-antigen ligase family protein [Bacillota bacterium]
MSLYEKLFTVILLLAPAVKGLYYEQEMFIFQTAVFAAFALFVAKYRQIKLNRPLDFAVLVFLAAYLFTLPGAADFREALLAVMRILAYFMLYLMVAAKARDDNGRLSVLRTVYLSGVLVTVVTLLNLTGVISTSGVWDGRIIHTTFEYKNAGALFLLVCTLIGVYLGRRSDSVKIQMLIGVGNYLNLLMIIGTQSRAVWVLAPITYTLMLVGIPAGKRGPATVKILISLLPAVFLSNLFLSLLQDDAAGQAFMLVLTGAVLAAAGIYGWLRFEPRFTMPGRTPAIFISAVIVVALVTVILGQSSTLLARLQSISLSDYSFQDRFIFFRDAWKIISDRPFFGAGGKGWDVLYLNIQSYGYYAENVHNDFLQVAVEAGFLGLLAFISVWAVFYLTGWKIYRQSQPDTKEMSWMLIAAGTTVMLHSLLDFDLAHSALAFVLWSFFAIIRAMGDIFVGGTNNKRSRSCKQPLVFPVVLAAGLLYSAASLSFFAGDMFFAKGERVLESGDLVTTREYFEKALSFDPWKTNNLVSLAQINLAMFEQGNPGALDQALDYAEMAIRRRPNEPLSHSVFSTALFYKGDYAQSAAEMEKYVSLHPMLLRAYEELAARYINIGLALIEQGALQESRRYFDKTLQISGMIDKRLKNISSHELDLWQARNAEPVLAVTPRIEMYTGAAQIMLGNPKEGGRMITEAAGQAQENPEIMMWYALALELTDSKDRAQIILEQAAAQNQAVMQSFERIKNLVSKVNQ